MERLTAERIDALVDDGQIGLLIDGLRASCAENDALRSELSKAQDAYEVQGAAAAEAADEADRIVRALRSELEAMRPVVNTACDLMAPFQWTTAGMNRLREAVGAYRDSRPERFSP